MGPLTQTVLELTDLDRNKLLFKMYEAFKGDDKLISTFFSKIWGVKKEVKLMNFTAFFLEF